MNYGSRIRVVTLYSYRAAAWVASRGQPAIDEFVGDVAEAF